jgi:hypothetical protein
MTCVCVGWIYLTRGAQLQAVVKTTRNWRLCTATPTVGFSRRRGAAGAVTLDLEVTNGYGVLCSEGRALAVERSDHIHLRATDSIMSQPNSVAL